MMKNKNSFKETFMKNKKIYISVFVCLLVVYALLVVGIGTTPSNEKTDPGTSINENSVAQRQVDETKEGNESNNAAITPQPEITSVAPTEAVESEAAGSGEVSVYDEKIEADIPEKISFNPDEGIAWPVEGEIIMGYSMEHGVYHETLCQFMTNDGLLIDSQNGEMAKACCDGTVSAIYDDVRRGKCVDVTAGDYTFTYGQLSSVSVSEGDTVQEGMAVGMIGEPTKYYSEEGVHLYFKVMCGEETVDPETLLRD